MDFKNAKAVLETMVSRFAGFRADNPTGKFTPFHMPIEQFQKAPELTKEALGDAALDTVWGVIAGTQEQGSVSVFTGNGPLSPDRAAFLCDILGNFDPIMTWALSYVDQRETGYSVAPLPATPENPAQRWIAIGPGFRSPDSDPHAVADTPQEAMARLLEKLGNLPLADEAWPDEMRVLAFDTQFSYARSHPDKPGEATVPDDRQTLRITGQWTRPGTRYAVKTHREVPLLTEQDAPEMIAAKRSIIEELWQNRDRAGGVSA
jgi:hypothetical protein